MTRRHSGEFTGSERRFGFPRRATATLAGLALAAIGAGCSIGEAGAGASSSPEVTTASATTPTAEATPTPTAERTPKMVAPGELPTVEQLSVENLEKDECIMYADTRLGRMPLIHTIQGVKTDGRDFVDWNMVTVTFTLQDGKIVPVACEYNKAAEEGIDPQTFVNSSNTELCRK